MINNAWNSENIYIFWFFFRKHFTVVFGGIIFVFITILCLSANIVVGDPIFFNPINRLMPPSTEFLFGTDQFGRNILNRTIYGGRISLLVGLSVAILSSAIGLMIGLLSGFFRTFDMLIMRIMDGFLAIPSILLAIALVSLTEASIQNVIIAITVSEIPRVVRLSRSVVLTIRDQPYVDAAIVSGCRQVKIIYRHILPNSLAPIIVQATFICASAIIIESALSFLGAGTPPEIPSWGNMIAEGRSYFQLAPWIILFPGLFLALLILSVNLLGDGLRDMLDPKIAKSL